MQRFSATRSHPGLWRCSILLTFLISDAECPNFVKFVKKPPYAAKRPRISCSCRTRQLFG
jgi:hypothetical protein